MTKYELDLRMEIDNVADQPVTLVFESFDKVMLRTDAHLYILQSTRQDRETGPLKALHDIFLCKHHPPPLPMKYAEDSWFRMEACSRPARSAAGTGSRRSTRRRCRSSPRS